jgi:salicylate hydroxylase
VARVLRNLLFKSRKDNDFQYNDWLYAGNVDGSPALVPARSSQTDRIPA